MKNRAGFTIVELLIVVVVIAILATITIIAYNGIQIRARDTVRKTDIATITKALENYYTINGEYPASTCSSSCAINSSWSTTADGSWSNLAGLLAPSIITKLPNEPLGMTYASSPLSSASRYHYSYFSPPNNGYCSGAPAHQLYKLAWRFEYDPEQNISVGTCDTTTGNPMTPNLYTSSEYTVVK